MKKVFFRLGLIIIFWTIGFGFIYSQTTVDLAVAGCNLPGEISAGSSVEVVTTFKNVGELPITSFVYSWVMTNTETKKSMIISGENIAVGETKDIPHKFLMEVPMVNCELDIEIYVASINSNKDINTSNDTLLVKIKVIEGYKNRLAVIDHFTSMHCGPCATTGPELEALLKKNDNMSKVAYMSIHTGRFVGVETLHNPSAANRDNIYLPASFPQVYVGGTFKGMPNQVKQMDINQEFYMPSYVESFCNYNIDASVMQVGGKLRNLQDFSADTEVFFAVVETVEFATPPGTNGETHFPNVLRKFIPDGKGIKLSSLNIGDEYSYLYKWQIDENVDIEKIKVYMFVQDVKSKKYFAAEKLEVGEIVTVSNDCLTDIKDRVNVLTYGNKVTISSLEGEDVKVQLINMNGQVIDEMSGIECIFEIERKGIYVVRIIGKNINYARKIITN